ncbi:MAG: flagellar hook-associated protein FlgL [Myxococcota bacterium]
MPFRISDATIFQTAVRNARLNRFSLAQIQAEIGSGKRINSLADDPSDARRILDLRSASASVAQFRRNVDSARARLEPAEAALASLTDSLTRLRELAVSADIEEPQFDLIKPEVEQLYDEMLQLANTRTTYGFIFGGFVTDAAPFTKVGDFVDGVVDEATPDPDVVYSGDGGIVRIQIGEATTIEVNVPGAAVFGGDFTAPAGTDPGRVDLFDVVREFRNRLEDPTDPAFAVPGPAEVIDDLDTALDQILELRARIGASLNRLDATESRLQSLEIVQEAERSRLEDVDFISASTKLAQRENIYQASLAVTARVLQPSLLDFLR